jgi:hypothetical protein
MTSVRDGRELAGLALAETIDATQVLSEGALGGNTEPSIRSARVSLSTPGWRSQRHGFSGFRRQLTGQWAQPYGTFVRRAGPLPIR